MKREAAYYMRMGSIYMLHRCAPINEENLYWNEHMKVSPEYLENFLKSKAKYYNFITLDDLYALSSVNKKIQKKFIIMTFDDGYLDNYEYALPIFDKLHIPFTVYISNSFPDKTSFLWWYIIEDIIQKNSHIVLSNGKNFYCESKNEKEKLFLLLRSLVLKLDQNNLKDEFVNLFSNYEFDCESYNNELCLSWNMVREMSENKYCTIGSHTMNHKTLNQLTDVQLEYEIIQGKQLLEKKVGKTINHFSYPFGTFNEISSREIEFMKKSNFNTGVYSFGGGINKNNIKNLFELPRMFFGELSR
jgi:peptidoglycan/xylan/chitin deacetylase (PgdA/CDA1 family)